MKSILKETCIMILLCVAVVLIFAIVFYDFIPNEVIPTKVAYTVPDDIKAELEEKIDTQDGTSSSGRTVIHAVTSSDLEKYEDEVVYLPGNINPFQAYSTGNNNSVIIGTGEGISNGNNGSSGNTNTQSNYQSSKGIK